MKRLRRILAVLLLGAGIASCSIGPNHMNEPSVTREAVVAFLHHFEEVAARENFDLIEGMIDDHAFFRFNDGDFVGKAAIRGAFEKTWKSGGNVKKDRFYLTDIVVTSLDRNTASATYTYNWEGSSDGRAFRIQGRGTRVLGVKDGRFLIVHEHLSRFPKQ